MIWGHISFSSSNYASLFLCLSLREVVNILANVCAMIKLLTHPNAPPCTSPPMTDWLTTSSTPQAKLQLNQKAWTKGRFMCSRPSYFSFFPLCWGRTLSAKISSSHLASILPAQGATLLLLHHVFPWDSPWDSPLENDNVSTGGCKNCRWIFIASGEFSLTFSLYFLLFLAGFKMRNWGWNMCMAYKENIV